MSISGGSRHHDQQLNKVTVIGGGDLGMASVMSILSKVITFLNCMSGSFIQTVLVWIKVSNSLIQMLIFFSLFLPLSIQCKVDKLVFVDVAESSTKGGSTDLEIFSLPKVEVSRGTSLGWVIADIIDCFKGSRQSSSRSSMTHLYHNQLLCCSWLWTLTPSEGQHKSCIHQRVFEMRNNTLSFGYFCYRPFFFLDFSASAGSKVVVVTANAWSSEQSYVSVVQTNVDLYRGFIPNLARLSPNAVLVIASQPGWCRRKINFHSAH